MRTIALSLVMSLALAGAVMAASQIRELPITDATSWGMTTPHTQFEWTYAKAPTPAIKGTPKTFLDDVGFALNSATLTQEARGSMVKDVDRFLRRDGIVGSAHLVIVGYADNVKEASQAHDLGLRRAEAVRDYLVSLGVKKADIQVTSYGDEYSQARPYQEYKQMYERRAGIWLLP